MKLYKKVFHLLFANILIVLFFAFTIWMIFFDENSLTKHVQIIESMKIQDKKIENYIEKNEQLQSAIEVHETDTMNSTFEKVLREEYGLAKKDEIIFKLEK